MNSIVKRGAAGPGRPEPPKFLQGQTPINWWWFIDEFIQEEDKWIDHKQKDELSSDECWNDQVIIRELLDHKGAEIKFSPDGSIQH